MKMFQQHWYGDERSSPNPHALAAIVPAMVWPALQKVLKQKDTNSLPRLVLS